LAYPFINTPAVFVVIVPPLPATPNINDPFADAFITLLAPYTKPAAIAPSPLAIIELP